MEPTFAIFNLSVVGTTLTAIPESLGVLVFGLGLVTAAAGLRRYIWKPRKDEEAKAEK